jgi:membrane-bound ClpP family serine protease
MVRKIVFVLIAFSLFVGLTAADTFTHRQSGEQFDGYATQKSMRGKTRVYSEQKNGFETVNLDDYEITYNSKGRHKNVILFPITQPQVMLSQTVSLKLAKLIADASNKGPLFIIIQIDSPGGRGEYMKNICAAITKTTNCPVVAYVTSRTFGGAYSAAAGVAVSCPKIYISPDASIGSAAPAVGQMSIQEQTDFANNFAGSELKGYGNYLASLAERNLKPAVVAMALVDSGIEVVQVTDAKKNMSFIDRAKITSRQSIVRTISKPAKRTIIEKGTGKVIEISENAIMLTPADAVACSLADGIVLSVNELLAELNAGDARIVRSGVIDKEIRKFVAKQRDVDRILVNIDFLNERAEELSGEIKDVRQWVIEEPIQRRNYVLERKADRSSRARKNDRRRDRRISETITTAQPIIGQTEVMRELIYVLDDLAISYRRLLPLARRWPGTLGARTTVQTIERQLNSTQMQRNSMFNRLATMQNNQTMQNNRTRQFNRQNNNY